MTSLSAWTSRVCATVVLVFGLFTVAHAEEVAKPVGKASKSKAAAVASEATEETVAPAAVGSKPKKIKYRAGKQVDFDKQTIQGELRRPELSVVIGNEKTTDNGLLRLREDFVDRITAQAGEEVE